ncbi:MAG: tripartite tricarboxylate transporter TctB family protein [Pseudomonadota bacterium]
MSLIYRKDFWAGLLMLLFGVAIVFVLIPIGVDEPRKVKFAALSPSYYPRIIAICLSLLGLVVAIRAYLSAPPASETSAENRPDGVQRVAIIFCMLVAMAFVLPTLGFIVTTTLVLAACVWYAGERRYGLIAALSIGIPLLLYFFFLKIAGIPIPLGVLAPLLAGV